MVNQLRKARCPVDISVDKSKQEETQLMETPAIPTEGLTKRYGKVDALKDLNLKVRRGEVGREDRTHETGDARASDAFSR
jgi:hypothetical protein